MAAWVCVAFIPATNLIFRPAMSMLAAEYTPKLDALPHLLKDSFALKRALDGLSIGPSTRFIQLDIKEYYVTGDHTQFVDSYRKLSEYREHESLLRLHFRISSSDTPFQMVPLQSNVSVEGLEWIYLLVEKWPTGLFMSGGAVVHATSGCTRQIQN